ncbi:hypothetical protein Bca52824_073580 [Brassica carinata]|uniref:Uncharacterized protein n=1 Tax=Brassica carinata TaxID=52824 RepID=A0A8X7QA53_BRACI|nr:hypothetical protein Bca52824_073580 [Brassica carinata]
MLLSHNGGEIQKIWQPIPSFSLELTHEDRVGIIDEVCENPSNNVDDVANEDLLPGAADDQPLKKSKRARVAPPSLVSDYHCGSKKHKRARVEQIGFNPTSFSSVRSLLI